MDENKIFSNCGSMKLKKEWHISDSLGSSKFIFGPTKPDINNILRFGKCLSKHSNRKSMQIRLVLMKKYNLIQNFRTPIEADHNGWKF
jgi:hypothetical protein